MFQFSFHEYLLHELIINGKIDDIIQIKNSGDAEHDIFKKITNIIKVILANHFKSAGLTSCIQKLDTLYQEQKRLEIDIKNGTATKNSPAFFQYRAISNDIGPTLYTELMEHVFRFSNTFLRTPTDKLEPSKLANLILLSGISRDIFTTLNQIHRHVHMHFYPPMPELLDFHEYLSQINICADLAGRLDLSLYLKNLEAYLRQFYIPVKGDTNSKQILQALLSEIAKIQNKLSNEEQKALDMELVKIRAFNLYLATFTRPLEEVKTAYRDHVAKNNQQIEERYFSSDWSYINEQGFLNNPNELLSELHKKIQFLKKIFTFKPEFDLVINKIKTICNQPKTKSESFTLYRYVSEGEFQSLKSLGVFAQHARFSTSENAKWFFYGNGKPGVTNEYLCEVHCIAETADLIQASHHYPNAMLTKENEPDCIGVHEEVLAHFNQLISGIRITQVKSNKTVEFKPTTDEACTQQLPVNTKETKPSLYFAN